MSYHDRNPGGYSGHRDNSAYPRNGQPADSQYPPPPGEEDDRNRPYHQRAPSSSNGVTLPPMSPYEPQYSQPARSPYDEARSPYAPEGRAYPPLAQPPQGAYQPQATGYSHERSFQPQPPQEYRAGNAQEYRPSNGQQHMAFSQSAPRQRTAIACKYCRRRKIRCSGFDQNPEGRCTNCLRFQQECVFTPVSSQAQAFVPAHVVFPHLRQAAANQNPHMHQAIGDNRISTFGAHGEPLGSLPAPYDYPAPSPTGSFSSTADTPTSEHQTPYIFRAGYQYARNQGPQENYPPLAPPQESYPYPQHGQATLPTRPREERPRSREDHSRPIARPRSQGHGRAARDRNSPTYRPEARDHPSPSYRTSPTSSESRKRRAVEDAHPSILPPPMPSQSSYPRSNSGGRRQGDDELRLPPVTPGQQASANYSPGSSASSHSNLQPPLQGGLPPMSRTPPPRTSPGAARTDRVDPMKLGNIMARDNEVDRKMLDSFNKNNK
ncbi:Zn2/Cys6 DNA-binding protein [Glarea lozoyensis ATCC 20868]|uniref:Zn2/Cys6 DNA-binding protein n=1 Tax=Glarea lozoyensis (strain ATCC 20868 / MF5171) TaxID=1116229 RepID=S3DJ71_GLAL2|nr:Zn2/Cys6 DNA-binding protein [Glarea lozoyensis ATCC 20868]EPE26598.1 Zn2/Cys6 DNA-binding protein [Glarea lozoyensis ATCC 20868]